MATAGYTTIGTLIYFTGFSGGTNEPGLLITIPSAANISKITAYVANTLGSTSSKCQIYAGSAGARNSSVIGITNSSTVTSTFGWVDFNFPSDFPAVATTYWIEFEGDGGNGPGGDIGQIKYDTGGPANSSYFLSDASGPIYGTDQYSMYATYTPTSTTPMWYFAWA